MRGAAQNGASRFLGERWEKFAFFYLRLWSQPSPPAAATTALNRCRPRQVPGREQEVWDYFRKNPGAVNGIRAPMFEDKVIDFLVELAKVTEKQVSREELLKDDDEKTTRG